MDVVIDLNGLSREEIVHTLTLNAKFRCPYPIDIALSTLSIDSVELMLKKAIDVPLTEKLAVMILHGVFDELLEGIDVKFAQDSDPILMQYVSTYVHKLRLPDIMDSP